MYDLDLHKPTTTLSKIFTFVQSLMKIIVLSKEYLLCLPSFHKLYHLNFPLHHLYPALMSSPAYKVWEVSSVVIIEAGADTQDSVPFTEVI